jgi:hypothetical protein
MIIYLNEILSSTSFTGANRVMITKNNGPLCIMSSHWRKHFFPIGGSVILNIVAFEVGGGSVTNKP